MFCINVLWNELKRFSLSLILLKLIKIVCILTVNQSNLFIVIYMLCYYLFINLFLFSSSMAIIKKVYVKFLPNILYFLFQSAIILTADMRRIK